MGVESLVRHLLFRWSGTAALLGAARSLNPSRRTGTAYLAAYDDADAMGPMQRSEALLLHAMVQVTQPRTIVEFGFYLGHSANVLLKAAPSDTLVASYEIDPAAQRKAQRYFGRRPNHRLFVKSQTDFEPGDVDGRPVNLAFIDASHDFDLNCACFEKLNPSLADDALIVSHDTGLWHRDVIGPAQQGHVDAGIGTWVDDDHYAHVVAERRFVDWIQGTYPAFGAVHFHSTRVLRHGMSILQRQRKLANGL
ncbi:O-methyltransferase [Tepidamorphus sp. 3E244]|uniref:O-methyltransferase n=1 Tax=Tepidamorphus sp. 3E244 TaxID=3385498 RepID=UPI0038FCBA35